MTDVGVTIAEAPDPVAAGSLRTYTLTANNIGPNPASQVHEVVVVLLVVLPIRATTAVVLQQLNAGRSPATRERSLHDKTGSSRSPWWSQTRAATP